jgi:hypothetical protein
LVHDISAASEKPMTAEQMGPSRDLGDPVHAVSALPPEPVNVTVHLKDGTSVPIELVYTGCDEDGDHRWEQVSPAEAFRCPLSRTPAWTCCPPTAAWHC